MPFAPRSCWSVSLSPSPSATSVLGETSACLSSGRWSRLSTRLKLPRLEDRVTLRLITSVSSFVTLRSKSPVCGEKYAAFKKKEREKLGKASRQTGMFHQPTHCISLYVPVGQRCTNRAKDFRIPVAAAADGGVWERRGNQKTKKETFLTRVSCFVVTRKQA